MAHQRVPYRRRLTAPHVPRALSDRHAAPQLPRPRALRPASFRTLKMPHLDALTLLVRDYDEAIAYFTEKLDFELIEDTPIGDKRWVLVAPRGSEARILLARASTPEQAAQIGRQAAGRVFLFLRTDDFERDY